MPTNVYFNPKVKTEQMMYEDIIIESLRMYGQDVYYLPRTIVTKDMLLGEVGQSAFNDSYLIEMYIENTEGFDGEGNIFSKFGLEIRDEASFVVAKRTWDRLVGNSDNTFSQPRPNEGDLIYLPLSNSFFEITFVEHQSPFYQLANLPTYKLQASLFEYSGEDFNTSVPEVDAVEIKHAYTVGITVSSAQGELEVGDRIYQILTRDEFGEPLTWISGELTRQVYTNDIGSFRELYLDGVETSTGEYAEFFVGQSSDDWILKDVSDREGVIFKADVQKVDNIANSDSLFNNDDAARNVEFEREADDIIDFSEINPFGEPNDV